MRNSVLALSAALILGTVASVSAHELMIKPEKMNGVAGDDIRVSIVSSHRFIIPEEVEDVEYIKAGVFRDGKITDLEIKPDEAALDIAAHYKLVDDKPLFFVAAKESSIYSVTNKGGRSGTRAALEAEGLKVKSSTRYDKYVKCLMNNQPGDKTYEAVVGHDVEIIPLMNPAEVKVGDFLPVKVLHRGSPVSVSLCATYDGFVKEYENTYAYYTEAGGDGLAHIKITAPGIWMVRVSSDEKGVEGEYDARVIRSVLVFEVK